MYIEIYKIIKILVTILTKTLTRLRTWTLPPGDLPSRLQLLPSIWQARWFFLTATLYRAIYIYGKPADFYFLLFLYGNIWHVIWQFMIIWQYMACYMAIYNYVAICLQDDNIWITPDHAIVHGSLDLFHAFYIESIYQAMKICRQQRTMNIETS